MKLVTIGEAIAWICTRDVNQTEQLSQIPRAKRLWAAFFKFRGGTRLEKRVRADSPPPVGGGEHATAQEALVGLQQAIQLNVLPTWAHDPSNHQITAPVSVPALNFVELRAFEGKQASCAFWSILEEKFVLWEPLVCLEDLKRLWPAPSVSATSKTSERILRFLLDSMPEKRLKKDDAKALTKEEFSDFSVRGFEKAWKQVPSELKHRVGERGPSRILK